MPNSLRYYHVVGRKLPTATETNPPLYRMRLFAPNKVVAKSRFWYFLHTLKKLKKTTGQILSVNEIVEKNANFVKNYGFWLRYNSRSGTHNMYKEYRDISLVAAAQQMYNDLAARHRARDRSVQVIRTAVVKAADTRRPAVQQFHTSTIKFPLPHRLPRPSAKKFRTTYKASRPTTYLQ